ncbi:hypothetical protein GMRT_12627 [Giardia muris]|uniref:XPG N-terminal domain-containing protein n=1 Tax=Giardia muris TaxID=5742 RepID=A0A4Z1SU44_GIAMU|nr:hypothetical protein GMRT_12627 [Giardia muris]|eukprot:TNJ28495.1 hypothetical protein GMRT_12627 [Giardia muris]
MAVRHLARYVQQTPGLAVREALHGTERKRMHVVVDGEALLYYLYMSRVDWSYGGENPRLTSAVAWFVGSLQKCAITPLVFFSPHTWAGDTAETRQQRYAQRLVALGEACAGILECPAHAFPRASRGFRFHPLARQTFIEALRSCEVKLACTDGPLVPYVAAYSQANSLPVMAYEPVYLACGIPYYIHLDSVQFKRDELHALVIRPEVVRERLGLDLRQFQLLCTLLPSDYPYAHALEPFRSEFALRDDPDSEASFRPESVPHLARFVVEHLSDDTPETLSNFITLVLKKNGEALTNCPLPNQSQLDDLALTKGINEFLAGFLPVDSKVPIAIRPTSPNLTVLQALPAWVLGAFRSGKVSQSFLTLLNADYVVCEGGLEDCVVRDGASVLVRTSGSCPAEYLRITVYAMLRLSTVVEQRRMGGEWVSERIAVPPFEEISRRCGVFQHDVGGGYDYLAEMPRMTKGDRRTIVLSLLLDGNQQALAAINAQFGESSFLENANSLVRTSTRSDEKPIYEYDPDTDMFFIACLVAFLQSLSQLEVNMPGAGPALSPELLATILTSFALPITSGPLSVITRTRSPPRDLNLLTVSSALQQIMEVALSINALHGTPFAVQLPSLHNGFMAALIYADEMEACTSQMHLFARELAGSVPFWETEYHQEVKHQHERVGARGLSVQDAYVLAHALDYEVIRRFITVLRALELKGSSREAVQKLVSGEYYRAKTTGPMEARFATVESEALANQERRVRTQKASAHNSVHPVVVPSELFANLRRFHDE